MKLKKNYKLESKQLDNAIAHQTPAWVGNRSEQTFQGQFRFHGFPAALSHGSAKFCSERQLSPGFPRHKYQTFLKMPTNILTSTFENKKL